MPRDIFYQNKCVNPREYDKVIDWIRDNHPGIQDKTLERREEFAIESVHSCIRAVIYGTDKPAYCSTGMCFVVRQSTDPTCPDFKKVILTIKL